MFRAFFKSEAASGILLLAVTVLALLVANGASTSAPYFHALHARFGGLSLLHWINDGLMALFFLLVGLEIKRELTGGALSSWSQRALPGLAAVGGMAVPALLYAAVAWRDPGAIHGWAIPTATDIAFTLGVLTMFGTRVPAALKVFVTALAIIDDLLAVLIIALFYGGGLSLLYLGLAAAVLLLLAALNVRKVDRLWPYLLLGAVLWVFVLKSGIHATLAGVMLALAMPSRPGRTLEHGLAGWVAFGVVPIFAFANAGVSLAGVRIETFLQPVTLGVMAGLVLGKQIGIFGTAWLSVRLGLGRLPLQTGWRHVYGAAVLCGIGFTISLFIGALAFPQAGAQDAAKLGVLTGSLVSGMMGAAVLRVVRR
jgi:NhaA family Na+:H+ antiporter